MPQPDPGNYTSADNSLVESATLLNAVTTNATGAPVPMERGDKTFQAYGATSAGAGTGDIAVYASNVKTPAVATDGVLLGTISLTLGTTRVSDSFVSAANYAYCWGVVSNLTGTGAAVSLVMGF